MVEIFLCEDRYKISVHLKALKLNVRINHPQPVIMIQNPESTEFALWFKSILFGDTDPSQASVSGFQNLEFAFFP